MKTPKQTLNNKHAPLNHLTVAELLKHEPTTPLEIALHTKLSESKEMGIALLAQLNDLVEDAEKRYFL